MTSSRFRVLAAPLLLVFGAIATLPVLAQAPAAAEPFVAGTDYVLIEPAQPTSSGDKIEVLEVFGYSCIHCAHFAPQLNAWKKQQKEDVKVDYMPAVFGGIWVVYGRAYYAAQTMGVLDKTHDALFEALHTQKRQIGSLEDLGAWYGEHGVDAKEFLAAMESFNVNAKIAHAQEQVPKYGVEGTPSLIVNGKYRVMAPREGSYAKMLQITDFLVEKERATRKAG
jgi:thiol:disulfide interchange protein DsbA